jgi:hypothetical protein
VSHRRKPAKGRATLEQRPETSAGSATVITPIGVSDTTKITAKTEKAAKQMRYAEGTRRRERGIKDADYDRLAPKAKTADQLAGWLGVNPVNLSRYKTRRFGKKS